MANVLLLICTKQGILGIIPNSNIDVEYLYYFMRSSYFQKEVERVVTEGTMKTAYLKDINHIKFLAWYRLDICL